MKRRRRITLETEKLVIRRTFPPSGTGESCAALTPLSSDEAALMEKESSHLDQRGQTGQILTNRAPGGSLMICLRSLSKAFGIDCQKEGSR
jgi:hypothetical protein